MSNRSSASPSLDGKVTVITGASSGIGAAIAHRFAAEGSPVVLAARRPEKLQAVAQSVNAAGGRAIVQPADVTDYSQVEQLVKVALQQFGQIDVMVNNAGHALEKSVLESSVEDLDGQVDSNLRGVMYGCKAVLPHMIARQTGSVINVGSICSHRHFPNYAAYVAAKFAVLGFSRSVYEEVRPHGIRVNCLCPAAVNTNWADLAGADLPWDRDERLQPEDLAEVALMCVTMPRRVQIEQVILWPVCESTA